jgi:DNA-directed RNA polymerase subunit RPC12/RpoP
VAATKCPKCGSHRIYPSRQKSLVERVRRAITDKQPYRCHACSYRGWHDIVVPRPKADKHDELRPSNRKTKAVTADDLDRLDNR